MNARPVGTVNQDDHVLKSDAGQYHRNTLYSQEGVFSETGFPDLRASRKHISSFGGPGYLLWPGAGTTGTIPTTCGYRRRGRGDDDASTSTSEMDVLALHDRPGDLDPVRR